MSDNTPSNNPNDYPILGQQALVVLKYTPIFDQPSMMVRYLGTVEGFDPVDGVLMIKLRLITLGYIREFPLSEITLIPIAGSAVAVAETPLVAPSAPAAATPASKPARIRRTR